jgi:hypothetical protein
LYASQANPRLPSRTGLAFLAAHSRRVLAPERIQAGWKMAQIKTETFTATSEADASAKAAAWKEAHPTIKIIAEHKPIAAAAPGSAQPGRRKHLARLVSISIDYQD